MRAHVRPNLFGLFRVGLGRSEVFLGRLGFRLQIRAHAFDFSTELKLTILSEYGKSFQIISFRIYGCGITFWNYVSISSDRHRTSSQRGKPGGKPNGVQMTFQTTTAAVNDTPLRLNNNPAVQ